MLRERESLSWPPSIAAKRDEARLGLGVSSIDDSAKLTRARIALELGERDPFDVGRKDLVLFDELAKHGARFVERLHDGLGGFAARLARIGCGDAKNELVAL